ncbi:hypothetical protein [Candidatus Albibeggiatoa sp. nov. NOAA]|uniref:hypothetical protein n=1 Tax=Candidatus Albibeggiatoa sp. nov. NOAA TaxID=3162724 RepID=UPI0033001A26|nr:hypothetical protein [Thiotrichaceae bacterium]
MSESETTEQPAAESVLQKIQNIGISPVAIIGGLVTLIAVAGILTMAIQGIQKTTDSEAQAGHPTAKENHIPKNVGTSLTAAHAQTNFAPNSLTALKDPDNPNTETAFGNRAEDVPTKTLSNNRVETAFEQPANTLEDIKAASKTPPPPPIDTRPVPEQLKLKLQQNYELVKWTALTQDLLQLEQRWKNNLQQVSQKFSLQIAPNNNISIQTIAPVEPEQIAARDMLWSDVLDDMLEMETLRTAMTDIFAQQLYPQLQPSAFSQLSERLTETEVASSWQQLTEQILAVEDYRADMLQTAEQVLCCDK